MRWIDLVADGGVSWRSKCCFDPATLTLGAIGTGLSTVAGVASMGLGAAGIGATLEGAKLAADATIAGGDAAAQAGQMQKDADVFQAQQVEQNAPTEVALAQRQMLETKRKADLLSSSVAARASAGGINAGVGTPVADITSIAKRGDYEALMDLWSGENKATGDINVAKGLRYSGDIAEQGGLMQQKAAGIQAAATIAGGNAAALTGAAKIATQAGALLNPTQLGRAGIGYG